MCCWSGRGRQPADPPTHEELVTCVDHIAYELAALEASGRDYRRVGRSISVLHSASSF